MRATDTKNLEKREKIGKLTWRKKSKFRAPALRAKKVKFEKKIETDMDMILAKMVKRVHKSKIENHKGFGSFRYLKYGKLKKK